MINRPSDPSREAWGLTAGGIAVPAGVVTTTKQTLRPPVDPKDKKVVAAKAWSQKNNCWYGIKVVMHKDDDIRECGADGLSVLDQMAQVLMRNLEDVDGRFRYQWGDEAQGVLAIREWAFTDDSQERWDDFVRWSPQKLIDNK